MENMSFSPDFSKQSQKVVFSCKVRKFQILIQTQIQVPQKQFVLG